MHLSRSTLAAVAAGSLLTLGIGGAAVLAGSGAFAAASPSPTASAPPAPGSGSGSAKAPGGRFRHGPGILGGGVLHGDIVVKKADGSGTETLLVQSGTITAKGSGTVTVKSSDGFTTTWTVTSSTIIPGPRPVPGNRGTATTPPANGTLADLAVGAEVQAIGTKSGDGATARMIHSRPAGAPGQGGAGGWGPRHDHRFNPGPGAPGQPPSSGSPSGTPSATGAVFLAA